MQPGTMAKEKGKYCRQTEGYGIVIARLFVRLDTQNNAVILTQIKDGPGGI
jgi:hypothetical protein